MKPGTRSFYALAVQRAIDHIAATLDEALDLEALASRACLSTFHFHRVFKGMVGETPLELNRRLRLERAAARLVAGQQSVTQIAFDAGYETHEAFTRAFRGSYSTSPSGFRQRAFPRIEIAATCGVHYHPEGGTVPFVPRDSGGQHMEVVIEQMPALRVAGVPHTGPYNQISLAFGQLGAIAGPAGLFKQPGAAMIALYHDDPDTVPQDQLRSDAAIVVPDDATLPAGLVEQRLAGGPYARTLHVGPYETLGDAWARFMGEWLPASGHRVGAGASYEIYRNDPRTTPKEELRTDLYIPLAS